MNVTNSEKVLKNYCKAKGYEKPVYRITSRNSRMLDGKVYRFKHYVCVVSVNGFILADGDGFSKRIARKKSAMYSLQQLRVLELQNFWEVYQTILPQGLLKSGTSSSALPNQLIQTRKLMIPAASAVEIEELISSKGLVTPQSVFCEEVELRGRSGRERSLSSDSSNLLISAAIVKLKSYSDDDESSWKKKDTEESESKTKSVFTKEESQLFNEPLFDTDIREIIVEAAHEIETFEEKGQDDYDL